MKKTLLLLMITLAACALCACGSSRSIVGTWVKTTPADPIKFEEYKQQGLYSEWVLTIRKDGNIYWDIDNRGDITSYFGQWDTGDNDTYSVEIYAHADDVFPFVYGGIELNEDDSITMTLYPIAGAGDAITGTYFKS